MILINTYQIVTLVNGLINSLYDNLHGSRK